VGSGDQLRRDQHIHADAIVSALRGLGIHVDYLLAGDEGHTVARHANEVDLLERMLRFLAGATRC
jgi:dipeptidyl aminopeptidase/acylaminoacyl peptidase